MGTVAAGGASLALDSGGVFQTYDPHLEFDPEAPSTWSPQPYVADFSLGRPVGASTNLPLGFPLHPKQLSRHNQLAGEMYAPGLPSTSEDTAMVMASQLTPPQHRHTWSGANSAPWYA